MGDRAGLSGARSGQHADRSAHRLGDLPLLRIQPREDIHGIILPAVGHGCANTIGGRVRTALGVGALALAALFVTQAPAAARAGDPVPTPSPVVTEVRTFSYGSHVRQRMDVWWHPEGEARPAVFVIHGGWWASGDKKYMTEVSRSFSQLGFTVANIDYRLSGDAPWPAQRSDALTAISAVRRHAAQFNTDPDRYAVIGFSAGGHIAAAVDTYGDGLPGLRGVVGISPVVSPMTAYADGDQGADAEQRHLRKAAIALAGGCGPIKCPRIWRSMEPALHASPGDAPMLSVHSADEFVPPYHSEILQGALAEAGVDMTIMTMPGTQHSAPLYREPGVAESVEQWVIGRLMK
ncbi:alpha/beta hydrolase [Streptosporangiaceae bacterium NEAU-GS5]|nr:alpha/beta hydrolase [Streptosporangiaceae bacterium NEAU-GS5]